MSKKVLISLDDINNLIPQWDIKNTIYDNCDDHDDRIDVVIDTKNAIYGNIKRWFDAQPAVSGVVYTESSDMASEFLGLSKMETTESGVTIEEIEELIDELIDASREHQAYQDDQFVATDKEGQQLKVKELSLHKKLIEAIKQYDQECAKNKGSNEPTE